MTASTDEANLVEKPLLQPWPCEHDVELPARGLMGHRIDLGLDRKGRIGDPRYEASAAKRCDERFETSSAGSRVTSISPVVRGTP